ncbi:hypothetical protein NO559_02485 [Dasania sp. GY-MA-18]|uniref:Uncharacterized protein n=1 Tax=Dasania phycosphaerae TaxID=2950436 RepID=A0A9J6RI71_9GAMM|nr:MULTISPECIES: hypothetical protein [Dasania]MCR8921621.1 hypothetical protein [Dasania sp. GY-MA-18]MCZ0864049.1 hypothetical protein [Dasania phycosphaerae]MCZ0867777.1 hypothetical protein [Dasania phycosphaerae]
MRGIITNITVLTCVTIAIWIVGFLSSICLSNLEWIYGARIAATLPILVLFNRRSIRLGSQEDSQPTYKPEEVSIHWKSDDDWKKVSYKMYHYIDQLGDAKAKRAAIILTIIGIMYFFIALLLANLCIKP